MFESVEWTTALNSIGVVIVLLMNLKMFVLGDIVSRKVIDEIVAQTVREVIAQQILRQHVLEAD